MSQVQQAYRGQLRSNKRFPKSVAKVGGFKQAGWRPLLVFGLES